MVKLVYTLDEYFDSVNHRSSMIVDREPDKFHSVAEKLHSTFVDLDSENVWLSGLDNNESYFDDGHKQ